MYGATTAASSAAREQVAHDVGDARGHALSTAWPTRAHDTPALPRCTMALTAVLGRAQVARLRSGSGTNAGSVDCMARFGRTLSGGSGGSSPSCGSGIYRRRGVVLLDGLGFGPLFRDH